MSKAETKKQMAIERIIAYLLQEGLHKTGIRQLADAAGTSDRMLIYYFGSKDALLNQVLSAIADDVMVQLDALLGTHQRTPSDLLAEATAVMMNDAFEPAVSLWFELVGLAARGEEPYLSNAQTFADNWIQWIESRLIDPSREEARDLYGHIEGRLMLKIIKVK